MSILAGDMIIRTAIQLGLEEIRKAPYLIDDILSDCVTNPYLKLKYGQKQIDAAKEWFLNNNIEVFMGYITDRAKPPCITVTLGSSQEKVDMKFMADVSTETVKLMPNLIGQPVPYIVKPFIPASYDQATGKLLIPAGTPNTLNISVGMILVNPENGNGYAITDVLSDGVKIAPNIPIEASTLGIVPQYQYYVARVEHTFFEETYSVGLYAHGDPQTLLWLHSITMYALLRYREVLLEANGFTEGVFGSSGMGIDPNLSTPGGETTWTREINLKFQVENTWIKKPQRVIESISLTTPVPGDGYLGGITIISNLNPPSNMNLQEELWRTIQDLED